MSAGNIVKSLCEFFVYKSPPRQVADLLGHTTSEITELYYVKRDTNMLNGITDGFEL